MTDIDTLRNTRHASQLGLCIYVPPTIWTAQVDGAQTTGATTVQVKNVASTRTPSKHMLVWLGTTAGANDLGAALWRSYGAPNLQIGVHNCHLPNNAYVTVLEVVPPEALHLGIIYSMSTDLDTYLEDGNLAYTDENTKYPPLAKCGTHAVLFRDPNTGLATGKFFDHGSVAIADGATIASVLWSWRGGTIVAGSTATPGTDIAPNIVTWDTSGDYYCFYTVTDSNGKTHTRYFVVFVRDRVTGLLPYRQLECKSIDADDTGLWQTTLTVYTNADLAHYPQHSLAVLFADDYFNDVLGSIGVEKYRENILLVGYIRDDSVKQDWLKGTATFVVENLRGVLSTQGQLGGDLETAELSPQGEPPWHSLSHMTFNRAVHHVLLWHSTVGALGDTFLNLPDVATEDVTLPEGSLADQLTPLCAAVSGRWGVSAMGHLYFEPHPQLTDLAGRSTDYAIDTTLVDFRDEIDFGTEAHTKQVSRVDFWGVNSVGESFGSYAPANEWASGMPEKIDDIRVVDQTDANRLAGLYEAYHNLNFKQVVVPWRGNYRLFDVFPARPIAVTTPPNPRGINWSHQRCWITRVSYDVSKPGVLLATATVEMDISGEYGVTQPDPGNPSPYPPTIPAPPVPTPPAPAPYPGGPEVGNWRSKVYMFFYGGGVYYTPNFSGPSGPMPTWSAINAGLGSLYINDARPDPFSPLTRQYCLTDERILYRRVTPGNWTQVLTPAMCNALFGIGAGDTAVVAFNTDINVRGYVGATFRAFGANYRFYYCYSLDYGDTWHAGNGGTHFVIMTGGNTHHLQIGYFKGASPYGAGQVIYVPIYFQGVFSQNTLRVSTNKGSAWAETQNNIDWERVEFAADNYQDAIYALANSTDGSLFTDYGIWRSLDRGATWSKLLTCFPQPSVGLSGARCYSLHPIYPGNGVDATILRCIVANDSSGGTPFALKKSLNAGASWSTIALAATDTDGHTVYPHGLSVVQDAKDKIYFLTTGVYGGSNPQPHILVSENDGVTMVNKAGANWNTPPYTNSIPYNIGGPVHILQVWS